MRAAATLEHAPHHFPRNFFFKLVRSVLRRCRLALTPFRWLVQQSGVELNSREIYFLASNFTRHASLSVTVFPGFSGPEVLERQMGRAPRDPGHDYRVRNVQVHSITNALLKGSPRFNGIFSNGRCLIAERLESGPWDFQDGSNPEHPGHVKWQSHYFIETGKPHKTKLVEKGIFLGARAPYNYYHWLINGLPSLFVANSIAKIPTDFPVLIPNSVLHKKNLREPLELLLQGREIVSWDADTQLEVKEALVVDPPPVYDTPLSLDRDKRIPLNAHIPLMKLYRQEFLDRTPATRPEESVPTRLFLARPPDDERSENQDELIEVAAKLGFTVFHPEDHSFYEQVAAFSNAQFIIGPSGAAFTNLLFCDPGAKALLWKPEYLEVENFFANLAEISGATCYSMALQTGGMQDTKRGKWYLDPPLLRSSLLALTRSTQ